MIPSHSLNRFAVQLASNLSCLVESIAMGHVVLGPHEAADCQLCLDIRSAEELLARIDWTGEENVTRD